MTRPVPPDPAFRPGRRRLDLWAGMRLHLTAWLVLAFLALLLLHDRLLPGILRPYAGWGLLLAPLALAVALWVRGGRAGKLALHTASLALLLLAGGEVLLSHLSPARVTAPMRFPYPYRMHGCAPNLRPEDSVHGATTNDTGLRHPGPIARKRPGELRVVVLGGSAIFGSGATDEETPPACLQRQLEARLAARPLAGVDAVTVINAGQGWYASTNELVFLVTELLLYEPDVVVVVDGYNDLHHAVHFGTRPPANQVASDAVALLARAGGYRTPDWGQVAYDAVWASALLKRLPLSADAVVDWPRERHGGFAHAGPGTTYRLPLHHRLVMNWQLMHQVCEGLGVRALFALQPALFDKAQPGASEQDTLAAWAAEAQALAPEWHSLRAHVEAEATRLGLPYFRSDVYVRDDPRDLLTDFCHLTPQGNALLARAIAERLEQELAAWPWEPNYEGVRYPFEDGDPLWRPRRLADQTPWR